MLNRPENRLLAVPKLADMTVREYFMAHAPAEPQTWFKPVMPPKPVVPQLADVDAELRQDLQSWSVDDGQPETKAGIEWVANCEKQHEARLAWLADEVRQRYVQWPAAWADAVMAASN